MKIAARASPGPQPSSWIRLVVYSTRFWKFLLSPVIVTLLLRQYQLSRQVDSFYSDLLLDIDDAPQARAPTRRANATTNFVDLSTEQDWNFTTLGERWKGGVRLQLLKEERKRMIGVNPKGERAETIRTNFQRLHQRLDQVDPSTINDPSLWHKVTPEGYQETLQKARSSMETMVDKVYLDCVLWLLPHENITSIEIERDDRNIKNLAKNPKAGPLIRFQCDGENQASGVLQKKPCRSANLCLVQSDLLAWESYYSDSSKSHDDKDRTNTTTVSSSHYNHTDLRRRFATPQDESSNSAILTMVDTVKYLRKGKKQGKKKYGKSYFIWECFLNKASYALRTNRDFYIWIGGFEGDKENKKSNETTPILHQRNTATLLRTFGANCKPEIEDKNVVHYYKPIAFGALFRKLRSQKGGVDKRIWFVDADIFFNKEAFPDFGKKDKLPLSLDDYFDISPQASLLGSQNPSGLDDNILINGGLLGLRGTSIEPSDPLDDWVINLSALWWYCRCGERDQIALWLLLFATWSAESGNHGDFAYPGLVFENYLFSWYGVFAQAQSQLPKLQKTWSQETTSTWMSKSSWSTVPTDTRLYNGGKGFLTFSESALGGTYTYPLELPHVLLLPLDPFSLPSEVNTTVGSSPRSDFSLGIVRKDQAKKKALLTHTKNDLGVCYGFKCWPYLIRQDPTKIRRQEKKEAKKKEKDTEKGAEEKKDKEIES